ncbi:CASP-like protein [Musa troglodytarum]|uniref:CASP-like protein n=1 Tax=Musa troglodytarum TaxID=320322 RepID=A0A9E7L2V3_9LILI|nr:CASP-like protein [Musa troglodytarum]
MASTETSTTNDFSGGKTAPESGYVVPSRPPPNLFLLDFGLRVLLFASAVSGIVVMVTSKQTELIPVSVAPSSQIFFISRDAKFQHSPAFIYLVAALSVTGLYSIITMLVSLSSIASPSPSPRTLFLLILFDTLLAGVMASATGNAGSVAYIGLKGNSHVNWNKICNVYGKFCRHVGSSTAVSLVASIVLVLLVVLSSYSLYRRSR